MDRMIDNDSAAGAFLILDTLKKFVDLMDKKQSSDFSKTVRRFVLKGGTVLGLAHTNKNAGANGKAVYAGTSDIVDDFDCAFTIEKIAEDAGECIVQFDNFKRRGNVALKAAYGYRLEPHLTYPELLASVRAVEADEVAEHLAGARVVDDQPLIEAITEAIRDGKVGKMAIAKAAAELCGVGREAAIRVIDRYQGNDPAKHRWQYTKGDRGVRRYSLVDEDIY